jgi:hypothetical protein
VGETGATLEAVVDPGFSATTYRFDYGLTRSYGATTGEIPVPAANSTPQRVAAAIGNLKAGITYHYRVVATNAEGSVESPDQALTTVPPPVTRQTRQPRPQVVRCKRGFVKKRGKCRKKPKRSRKAGRKRRGSKRGAKR